MITRLMRRPSILQPHTCSSLAATLRFGAKKKKGAGGADAPDTKDLVNIWKDRKDPAIQSSDMYPPWLMKMLGEQYGPDDLMLQMYRGERIPEGEEQWTLARAIRRNTIKDGNRLAKDEWMYESDEEMGEDLGLAKGGNDDLDDVAQGEIDGEAKQAEDE